MRQIIDCICINSLKLVFEKQVNDNHKIQDGGCTWGKANGEDNGREERIGPSH